MHRPPSRSRLAVAVTAVALVAAACTGSTAATEAPSAPVGATVATTTPAGPPAPSTAFALFDGSSATLGDYAGRPIVLNFWASWCPSCVAEMSQAFRPAQETFGNDVTFIGMNIQDERNLAIELLDETDVMWRNAEDPEGALYRELGGLGMPFTVFIGASGEIVATHNGPLTEDQLAERITRDLLG